MMKSNSEIKELFSTIMCQKIEQKVAERLTEFYMKTFGEKEKEQKTNDK
jgi:hypothetical protein